MTSDSAPGARLAPGLALAFGLALVLASAAALPAAAQPSDSPELLPTGPDRVVAAGHAPGLDLAPLGDGFLVVWRGVYGPGDPVVPVWGQLTAADGTPHGERFVIGETVDHLFGFLDHPRVAATGAGQALVVWTGPRPADGTPGVYLRRVSAAGQPLGEPELLSGDGARPRFGPRVASAADGSFVVAWSSIVDDANRTRVFARWFAADGEPLGSPYPVSPEPSDDQVVTGVDVGPDGTAVVVWSDLPSEGSLNEAYAALLVPAGVVRARRVHDDAETQSGRQMEAEVAALADGSWVVVFEGAGLDEVDTWGRRFAADLTPLGPEVRLSGDLRRAEWRPTVAALPQGGFVVLWDERCVFFVGSECAEHEGRGVVGRVFAADLTPRSDEFVVQAGSAAAQSWPAVAAGPAGVLAVWNGGAAILARPLVPQPCPVDDPAVLCLGDGRFRAEVAWTDFQGNSGAGTSIRRGDDWGTFWFFRPANVELGVKILDGRPVNGHWWVFFASLTNVGFTLRVTDLDTGLVRVYDHPSRTFASRGDTLAFPAAAESGTGGAAPAVARTTDALAARLIAVPVGAATGAVLPPCDPAPTRLCLQDGQFAVEMTWRDFFDASGVGRGEELSGDSGYFWFFRQGNPEVLVKVLDGRPVNGFYWVFFASLTNVGFDLEVTHTATGESVTYYNELRTFASHGDTTAFEPPPTEPTP
ncbi:MAG TPA: hypothetical protein VHQ65_11520 [Thermoanaerobaculia bacterium]|nr:hypothetical protein [Thermoanaerobaculia bacterium]